MFLYKINNQFFLHKKEFSSQELQDIVSGMMVEYRKKVVPKHKEIAPLRKEHTPQAIEKVKKIEEEIPTPYEFFEQWGFTHVEIHGKAITTFEVLEREE